MADIDKIGFELELVCNYEYFDQLWDGLYQFNKQIDLSGDPSVRCPKGWRDLEIKTKPLKPTQAMALLDDILNLIYLINLGGLVYANKSCGFHMSVSFGPDSDIKSIYTNVLRNYKDDKELIRYGRENNDTCYHIFGLLKENGFSPKRLKKDIELGNYSIDFTNDEDYKEDFYRRACNAVAGEKYASISLRNDGAYDNVNYKRLENRIIGGEDYFLRFGDVAGTMNHFLDFLTE